MNKILKIAIPIVICLAVVIIAAASVFGGNEGGGSTSTNTTTTAKPTTTTTTTTSTATTTTTTKPTTATKPTTSTTTTTTTVTTKPKDDPAEDPIPDVLTGPTFSLYGSEYKITLGSGFVAEPSNSSENIYCRYSIMDHTQNDPSVVMIEKFNASDVGTLDEMVARVENQIQHSGAQTTERGLLGDGTIYLEYTISHVEGDTIPIYTTYLYLFHTNNRGNFYMTAIVKSAINSDDGLSESIWGFANTIVIK